MSVAVVTAIVGGYDTLLPHPDIPGVDFFAYVDGAPVDPAGWEVRRIRCRGTHPRMVAKRYKLHTGAMHPAYDYTVWVDGSHEILTTDFVDWAVDAIGPSGMAMYQHPWRDCIYDEAGASVILPKYADTPIWQQAAAYAKAGHPTHWGLWACGTIARRNGAGLDELMKSWEHEIDRWTYQDQLSLPVVCRRAGIRPEVFPARQVDPAVSWVGNERTAIHPHHSEA